jgi:hypothetical protein
MSSSTQHLHQAASTCTASFVRLDRSHLHQYDTPSSESLLAIGLSNTQRFASSYMQHIIHMFTQMEVVSGDWLDGIGASTVGLVMVGWGKKGLKD